MSIDLVTEEMGQGQPSQDGDSSTANGDCANLMFAPFGGELGRASCGNCLRYLSSYIEDARKREESSRSPQDMEELEAKFTEANKSGDGEKKRKKKMAALLIWMNKDKSLDKLLRCPECGKIITADF